ncbi:hypothetical protein [Cellulosimicrobium arenosum]|uniref:Uncharacterized protein n=1 Tax=Cellulosimicrobium arenosum TaxID=2708133 RepID=A0A927G7H2_9MICO|nr:hypothetical protein [Cellulosimicrobium arenosum]MBD8077877.1 hypothetical protein [Cellulosimicrobium arenosum]
MTGEPPVEDAPLPDPDLERLRRQDERGPLFLVVLLATLGLGSVVVAVLLPGPARPAAAVFAALFLGFGAGWFVRWAGTRRHWRRAVDAVPVVRWTGTGRGSPETTNRATVVELSAELVPVPFARFLHAELVPPRALKGPVTVEIFRLDEDGRGGGPARFSAQGRVRWARTVRLSDEERPPRRAPRRPTPDLSPHS